ncbi:MAG: heme biosynthesis protein HemY [Bauldia sp.]|nr:heme biosynthesis protein HemY [Bauldia sp.]
MIRILLLIIVVFALAAGFVWLADNPGEIAVTVAGYEVRTTLMALAIAILVLVLALVVLWAVARLLIRAPFALRRQNRDRRRDLGQQALAKGLIAAGAGDATLAAHYAAELRHYAKGEPTTLFLSAEAARLSGDQMGARTTYETMVAHPETRLLGLRGLFLEAQARGDDAAARSFADEGFREKPGIAWAANALLDYQAADGEWAAALTTLSTLTAAGTIDGARGRRLKAILLTARAEQLEAAEPETARDLAVEAHQLVPELVPAAVLASRVLSRLGDAKKAGRIIETSWRIEPHPELAAAYMSIRPGESGRDRLRRIRALVKIRANHLEGQLALARAAIEAQDWATAREELRSVTTSHPSERAYLMMAEIEEGEHRDIGRARDWLSRAVRAPRDPAWTADGFVFDHWEPVSPISGRIDAFEWKVPAERHAGDDGRPGLPAPMPAMDGAGTTLAPFPPEAAALAPAAGRAMVPVAGRALFPVTQVEPPPAHEPLPPEPVAVEPPPPVTAAIVATAVAAEPVPAPPTPGPEPVPPGNGIDVFAAGHQPDDPGPGAAPAPEPSTPPVEEAKPRRRFRLFS